MDGLDRQPLGSGAVPDAVSSMDGPDRQPLGSGAVPDACETAAAIRRGELSAQEAVGAAIRALQEIEPAINGLVTQRFEQALQEAAEVDPAAPLAGVPVLIKDYLATRKGLRHTESSRLLKDFVASEDSEYVTRLRRSGAIILATTNLPEFALRGTTEPLLNGPTRNPWNLERTVGGSSGGSAALVSALAVPAAHGNDAGGSIRCPASCCGLFGVKPTRGRNSLAPRHGDLATGIWTEHMLTRSVRDSAAFLDATCGGVAGDPSICPVPPRGFRDELGRDPGRLRIAMTVNPSPSFFVHPSCAEAVRDTARLCERLGHEVVEHQPRLQEEAFGRAYETVYYAGIAHWLQHWSHTLGRPLDADTVEPLTLAVLEAGRKTTGVQFIESMDEMQRHARALVQDLQAFDVWLTPTLNLPPVPLGWMDVPAEDPLAGFQKDLAFCAFAWFANATGQPAMSVPLYWDEDGLPVGTQFTGDFGREEVLFALAWQLEQARPWAARVPPVRARVHR